MSPCYQDVAVKAGNPAAHPIKVGLFQYPKCRPNTSPETDDSPVKTPNFRGVLRDESATLLIFLADMDRSEGSISADSAEVQGVSEKSTGFFGSRSIVSFLVNSAQQKAMKRRA